MKNSKILFTIVIILNSMISFTQTIVTVGGTGANYSTLELAFDDINSGLLTGEIEIQITGSTTEVSDLTLWYSGYNQCSFTSISIYPTVSGCEISHNLNNELIDFYGSDHVTIDGRVNRAGSTADLSIVLYSNGNIAKPVRFRESACYNTIRYCNIKSSYGSSSGIISFEGSTTGNGNDNNVIEYCNLTGTPGNRPRTVIFSSGGTGRENEDNIIRYNNIYDFFDSYGYGYGVNISHNSDRWTIEGNHFYQATDFEVENHLNFYVIRTNPTGTYTIRNNYIGGSAPYCGGDPWTTTGSYKHYLCAIYANSSTSAYTTIEGNTIANMDYTSVAGDAWDGIYLSAGNFNVLNNTIGSTSSTGSIVTRTKTAVLEAVMSGGVVTGINILDGGSDYQSPPTLSFNGGNPSVSAEATAVLTSGSISSVTITNGGSGYSSTPSVSINWATYSTAHCILNNSSDIVNISGNSIAGISTIGTQYYSYGIECIYSRSRACELSISNNTIGSPSVQNSIQASSSAGNSLKMQNCFGIYTQVTNSVNITNNTICNLTNFYEGSQYNANTRGIAVRNSDNLIENNTIYNIKSFSAQNGENSSSSAIGIDCYSRKANSIQSIRKNTIYNISNVNSSAEVDVCGIYYYGQQSNGNIMAENFIHSLSIASSNTNSCISGIRLYTGNVTVSNNIIALGDGVTTGVGINGIYDYGGSGNTINLYYNSVNISGMVGSATTGSTYSLYNYRNYAVREYKNNLFINERSAGSSGKHYAIYTWGAANLTIDYNNYYVSGSNSMLGKVQYSDKADLASWKSSTSQDVNSQNLNPQFGNAGGSNYQDYYCGQTLLATPLLTVTTDYALLQRSNSPAMGALERNSYTWTGAVSTDFATAGNWVDGAIPPNGANMNFSSSPSNHCYLDQERAIGNLENAQATFRFVLNGHTLNLSGSLNFTNGAQLDASAVESKIVFCGSQAQEIPSGAIYNNQFQKLYLNNIYGLEINNNFTVIDTLNIQIGKLVQGNNTLTLVGNIGCSGGSIDGSVGSNIIIGGSGTLAQISADTLQNLTINRSTGLRLADDLELLGALTLTNGILDIENHKLSLSGSSPLRTNGGIDASDAGAEIAFNNSSLITLIEDIISDTISNLSIVNNGGVVSESNLYISESLGLNTTNPNSTQGCLHMYNGSAYTILHMGINATTAGIGDVTGIIKRTSFIANHQYTFGNEFTTISFASGGTYPTELKVKVEIGLVPAWKTEAIARVYDFVQTGGNNCIANISTHYLDSELNGNQENELVQWTYGNPGQPAGEYEWGKANSNATYNWVSMPNVDIAYFPTLFDQLTNTLSATEITAYIWNGSQSTDWATIENWTPTGNPSSSTAVIIPNAANTVNDPVLPIAASVLSMKLEQGSVLNGASNAILNIHGSTGAWINEGGVFIPSTSKVVFNANSSSVAGHTTFYDLEVEDGASLSMTTNSHIAIAGSLVITGTGVICTCMMENTIEYNGSNQTVLTPNGLTEGYYHLKLCGTGTKTLPGNALNVIGNMEICGSTTVNAGDSLIIGGNFHINNGTIFNAGNHSHSINGNFECDGTFNSSSNGKILMSGTTQQEIFGDATISFNDLEIANSNQVWINSAVEIDGSLILSTGTLHIHQAPISFNGEILRTNGFIETVPNSILLFENSNSLSFPSNIFVTTPEIKSIVVNSTADVSLGNQNLIIDSLIVLGSGSFVFNGNQVAFKGNRISRTNGDFDLSSNGSTLKFINDSMVTLPDGFFGSSVENLTIEGSGGVTSLGDFTLNGQLNLNSCNPDATTACLNMLNGSTLKTLTMGPNSTTIGVGDVKGIVRRTSFTPYTEYTFGSEHTTVSFTADGTRPTELKVKILPGEVPTWKSDAVQRTYDFIQTGGNNCIAAVKTHYLESELNGNDEQDLTQWTYGNPGPPAGSYEWGRSNHDLAANWVEIDNVQIAYFPTTFGQLENCLSSTEINYYTWNGSQNTNWGTLENWTPTGLPSASTKVIIPDASTTPNDPTASTSVEILALEIQSGGVLNATSGGSFTVKAANGAWIKDGGVFNPSTSTVTFDNDQATISGNNEFYNIVIPNSKSLWMTNGCYMKIMGTVSNSGTWRTANSGTTIVEYAGNNQSIAIPNPSTNRYSNLYLSGSGNKTFPATALLIEEDLKVSGTAIASANAGLDINGSFNIETGAQFNAGSYTHKIAEDFSNEGTFEAATSTIELDGTELQDISLGNSDIYNLSVNNSANQVSIRISDIVLITNQLNLTDGIVGFSGSGELNIGSSASAINGSSASFVDGKITKTGTSAFVFPIGHVSEESAIWAPIGIDAPSGSSNISAEYHYEAPIHIRDDGYICDLNQLEYVSAVEYWDMTSDNAYPGIQLYWNDIGRSEIQAPSDLVVAHWQYCAASGENNWASMGGIATDNSNGTGHVSSTVSFSSYSPVTFGSSAGGNTLPVELVYFSAQCNAGELKLSWATASEINNSYFTLQKSTDAMNWKTIGTIDGAGNSSVLMHYSFSYEAGNDSYYQLLQTDYNGKEKVLRTLFSECSTAGNPSFKVIPNPAKSYINIVSTSNVENLEYSILNGLGKTEISGHVNGLNTYVNTYMLKPGVYFLKIENQAFAIKIAIL